jgi:hypothetical protein
VIDVNKIATYRVSDVGQLAYVRWMCPRCHKGDTVAAATSSGMATSGSRARRGVIRRTSMVEFTDDGELQPEPEDLVKVRFEPLVHVSRGDDAPVAIDLMRAPIPGGWLLLFTSFKSEAQAAAMTFVPDPTHNWDGESL